MVLVLSLGLAHAGVEGLMKRLLNALDKFATWLGRGDPFIGIVLIVVAVLGVLALVIVVVNVVKLVGLPG